MGEAVETEAARRLIAWAHMSIDGFAAGPDDDVTFLLDHALHEPMAAYFEGVWRGASTVLLGRRNYEGFAAVWPAVADQPDAAARDRAFATWLNAVEKVVFSRTLQDADWRHARMASGELEAEVLALDGRPESAWQLDGVSTFATGAVGLRYRRGGGPDRRDARRPGVRSPRGRRR